MNLSLVKGDIFFGPLDAITSLRNIQLTILPEQVILNKPTQSKKEDFLCQLDGMARIRLISPIFNQNLYVGKDERFAKDAPPTDLDLFAVADHYPLLQEVDKYILEATLKKGDCLYIPSHYWRQLEVESAEITQVTITFESISKFVDTLFEGLQMGIHED